MVIILHRIAHTLWRWKVPLIPWIIKILNRIIFSTVLPASTVIGQDVILSYQGLGTVIHPEAIIGDRAAIGTGVTLGGRSGKEGAPVIGEGAMIGSGAKVLGAIRIGKYASIGANAVVLADVPDYAVVVGVPARIVHINRPDEIPDYHDFKRS